MNLREVQLSSRCMIPVALALPINRDPAERANEVRERERRNSAESPSTESPFSFQL